MADTVITPDDVITAFGAYYIDQGQNMTNLKMRPFQPFETLEAFTVFPTDETVFRMSDVQVGEILQPYQDTFTPKGSVTFEPVQIGMFQQKIDQAYNPNNLVASWLGFLTANKTNRLEWPFVAWFISVYLMKQVDKDLETKGIYSGVYAAPTPGTAGTAIGAMNGAKKLINDAITASKITPITFGTPATDPVDFCVQVETFCKGIPELYWGEKIQFNMSKTLALRYQEGRRIKYNMYYAQESDLNKIGLFPNFEVAGRFSMNGSNKIWGTPLYNAWAPVKGYSNKNGFELEKVDRKVKIYTDWWMGIGFVMYDLVFTNDQDLS